MYVNISRMSYVSPFIVVNTTNGVDGLPLLLLLLWLLLLPPQEIRVVLATCCVAA